MEKIGWQVERLPGCQIFIKRLPLTYSIIKIQRPDKIPFEEIERLGKRYRALFVKLEPSQISDCQKLSRYGYQTDKSPLVPTKTWQLDLRGPEDKIFSQMAKDARYAIRKTEKNSLRTIIRRAEVGTKIFSGTKDSFLKNFVPPRAPADEQLVPSLSDFISLWHKNAQSRGFWVPIKKEIQALYEAFGKDACLLLDYHSNDLNHRTRLLAGALIIFSNQTAYYFHAASSPEGRKMSAPYLIVWEAIKLAKKRGCKIFDFEGIYDERFPNKSWLGFTHFKKSFGGKEIEYPGCFIKFYNPILRLLPI
jgi:lipid II:glycine glycyltransferase (peptidoglycan interpeptide bridge formation enzyme)